MLSRTEFCTVDDRVKYVVFAVGRQIWISVGALAGSIRVTYRVVATSVNMLCQPHRKVETGDLQIPQRERTGCVAILGVLLSVRTHLPC